MTSQTWLIPGLPFLAAVFGILFGRRVPGGPAGPAVLGTGAAAVLSLALLIQVHLGDPAHVIEHATTFTPTGGVAISVGTRVDGLSAVVTPMTAVVAFLVQLYSIAYMRGDRRYSSYAALVSLFTSAMLLVVVSVDLFELLVGWEVMGVCSYLLIGHYWEQDSAAGAAVKAFVTTRIGDVPFLFGIFTLGIAAHSFRIGAVLGGRVGHEAAVAGTLLLVAGVCGKSAQFPLHTWLPDAMAGPTPISALIHAATMVAAGVYVVARLYPVFAASPVTLDALAVIAAVTMLLAALAALAQDDLKRVLAYSTVSQLAYMVGGLSVGGWTASVFHLVVHAAFKALLFLAAGSVIRTVGTNLMSEMGGLARRMPLTFAAFISGAAALAGIPPFSGSFSKDAILGAARAAAFDAHPVVPVAHWAGALVYVVGLLTALVTAAYSTRMVVRTFGGRPRHDAVIQEAPWQMSAPVAFLGIAAAVLGVEASHPEFFSWLPPPVAGTGNPRIEAAPYFILGIVLVAVAVGVAQLWRRAPAADPSDVLPAAVRRTFDRAFFVDELYDTIFVRPLFRLATLVRQVDERGVDGVVNATGGATRLAGATLRLAQNGNVQTYATGLFVGVVVIAAAVAVLR